MQREVGVLPGRANAEEEKATGHFFEVIGEIFPAHRGSTGWDECLRTEGGLGGSLKVISHRRLIECRGITFRPFKPKLASLCRSHSRTASFNGLAELAPSALGERTSSPRYAGCVRDNVHCGARLHGAHSDQARFGRIKFTADALLQTQNCLTSGGDWVNPQMGIGTVATSTDESCREGVGCGQQRSRLGADRSQWQGGPTMQAEDGSDSATRFLRR